tara:strand:+ start:557 stop:1414 length:858 start_codon:yes stop_codon:yes gene_type:complete
LKDLNQLINKTNINSFVLGFPKCATTSLCQWLESSKVIEVTGPKETNLFAPEFAHRQPSFYPAPLSESALIRIEASTLNVYSKLLLETLADRKEIKVVILTRMLNEVAESWHRQMFKAGFITENLELERFVAGDSGYELENYRLILSHGSIIQNWLDRLGHDRVLILNSYELAENPIEIAHLLEKFFGAQLDLPTTVPKTNTFSVPRNKKLYSFLRKPVIKSIWYILEAKIKILKRARILIREKVLLKEATKPNSFKIDKVDWLLSEEKLANVYLSQNREWWLNR